MKIYERLLSLIFLFIYALKITKCYKFDEYNRFIVDEYGRHLIFHGVNVVFKLPPYIPDTEKFDPYFSFTDEDIEILKRLGMNMVRLGIIWESVETEEKYYNLELLKKMSEIVSKLEKENISVIIDAHQDMFGRRFCGEGAPDFYLDRLTYDRKCKANILSQFYGLIGVCLPLDKYNWRRDEKGLPLVEDCIKGSFIDYHKSPELMSIYNSFYLNESGVLDSFTEFWKVVANEFKGRKNIIGYDLWNEPWTANLWSDLKSLKPGYIDDTYLLDMYSRIDSGISEIDDEYTMLFQPVPFPDTLPLFGGKALKTFSRAPVNTTIRQQIFNVHSYCCMADQNICADGEPKKADALSTCAEFHENKIIKNREQAENMHVPLMVTEFGACSASEACYYEMLGFMKAADKKFVSWAYWNYKPYGDHTTTAKENEEGIFNSDGTIQNIKEKALTRSYTQAIQGYPDYLNFDDKTKIFTVIFKYSKAIQGPTRIYINRKLNYPGGYNLNVTTREGDAVPEHIITEVDENHIDVLVTKESYDFIIKIIVSPK